MAFIRLIMNVPVHFSGSKFVLLNFYHAGTTVTCTTTQSTFPGLLSSQTLVVVLVHSNIHYSIKILLVVLFIVYLRTVCDNCVKSFPFQIKDGFEYVPVLIDHFQFETIFYPLKILSKFLTKGSL